MKMIKIFIHIYIAITSITLAFPPLDSEDIDLFMEARYGGDTATVFSMIGDSFQYFHTPYIGLGVDAYYVDGSLMVAYSLNDTTEKNLAVGDRIHEHNESIVDSLGLNTNGPEGEMQKLIVTKKGDSVFTELNIPLKRYQYIQKSESFLEDIMDYSDAWYDYEMEVTNIISKKNKIVVHYKWEGSKEQLGFIYSFTAIEIFTLNKKKDFIEKIEGVWSEKQFRDQFR